MTISYGYEISEMVEKHKAGKDILESNLEALAALGAKKITSLLKQPRVKINEKTIKFIEVYSRIFEFYSGRYGVIAALIGISESYSNNHTPSFKEIEDKIKESARQKKN